MNSDEAIEHILLASDDEPENQPRITAYKFRERSQSKGHRATYEIFNNHYLEVRVRRLHAKPCFYFIDLAFLAAQPARRVTIAWPLAAIALVAVLVTALLALWVSQQGPAMALSLALVTGTTAGVVGLCAAYRSSDKLVFYSRHGGIQFLELFNRRRANKEFHAFKCDLIERIQRGQAQYEGNRRELLAAELREHRRLKEEAVISEDNYQTARRRILDCHGAA